jgi:hypothetical protein
MEKRNDLILADGEVTGHAHRVTGQAEVFDDDSDRVLRAASPVEVEHEEHKTISLPAGEYRTFKQQEIDPDTEEARAVAD